MNSSGVMTRPARPAQGAWPARILTPFVVALIVGAAFLALAFAASTTPYFPFDVPIAQGLQAIKADGLMALAEGGTWIGLPPQSSIFYAAVVGIILLFRQWWTAIATGLTTLAAGGLYFAVEPLVGRPRPTADLVEITGSISRGSFPSGHILIALAVLGFVAYAMLMSHKSALIKTAVVVPIAIFLAVITFSRVYVGHHWPSDMLGGILLGTVLLAVVIGVFEIGRKVIVRIKR